MAIPPNQPLVLRTDGASRGNPGHAAAGVVVQSTSGEALATLKQYLGVMTNNQAEYQALVLGLQLVLTYQPSSLHIKMDSELIVKQMRGEYRVKSPELLPLYNEVRSLIAQLPHRPQFTHVPRGENSQADALANAALDEEAKHRRS
jgi:ribonuclease HI